MGAGNVTKDSWSRCETPSMLYNAVRNPAAPYHPPKASVVKDTIESTQQRLKREMLHSFQNKEVELPHEPYVAVVKVGKYVFLAVMLPVYFCFYGIPRWFLVNALPQFFMGVKSLSIKVGRLITGMTKRVTDFVKGLLEQLIGKALKVSKGRSRNFGHYLSSKMNRLARVISGFSEGINSRIKKIKKIFTKGSAKLYEKGEGHTKAANRWLVDHVLSLVKKMKTQSLRSLQMIDRAVLTPFIKLWIPSFNLLAKTYETIKGTVLATAKRNQEQINKILEPVTTFVAEAIRKGGEQVKKATRKFIEPAVHWLMEKKEMIGGHLHTLRKAVIDPVGSAMSAFKAKTKLQVSAGLGVAKQALLKVPKATKQSMKFASKLVPKGFKEKFKQRVPVLSNAQRAIRGLGKGVVAGVRGIFSLLAKLLASLRRLVIQLLTVAKQFFLWSFKQLVVFPRRVKRSCIAIFKVLSFFGARFVFAGHVLVALIWVTSVYGFQLVQQMTEPKRASS